MVYSFCGNGSSSCELSVLEGAMPYTDDVLLSDLRCWRTMPLNPVSSVVGPRVGESAGALDTVTEGVDASSVFNGGRDFAGDWLFELFWLESSCYRDRCRCAGCCDSGGRSSGSS
jgi:hypothetical protein